VVASENIDPSFSDRIDGTNVPVGVESLDQEILVAFSVLSM
jgi:hypothetical protein